MNDKNNQENNLTKNEIEAKIAVIETALAALQKQVTELAALLKANADTDKINVGVLQEEIQRAKDVADINLKEAFKRIAVLEKKVLPPVKKVVPPAKKK